MRLSTLNGRLGTGSRFSPLIATAFLAVALRTGVTFMAFVPRMLSGALLTFVGYSFVQAWAVQAYE